MSDSLAASLTMAFTGALVLALGATPPPRGRRLWLALALVCFFLMALSRVEKVYVGAALVCVTGLWLLRHRRGRGGPLARRRAAVVLALLAGMLGAAALVNRATQTHDPNQARVRV